MTEQKIQAAKALLVASVSTWDLGKIQRELLPDLIAAAEECLRLRKKFPKQDG